MHNKYTDLTMAQILGTTLGAILTPLAVFLSGMWIHGLDTRLPFGKLIITAAFLVNVISWLVYDAKLKNIFSLFVGNRINLVETKISQICGIAVLLQLAMLVMLWAEIEGSYVFSYGLIGYSLYVYGIYMATTEYSKVYNKKVTQITDYICHVVANSGTYPPAKVMPKDLVGYPIGELLLSMTYMRGRYYLPTAFMLVTKIDRKGNFQVILAGGKAVYKLGDIIKTEDLTGPLLKIDKAIPAFNEDFGMYMLREIAKAENNPRA